MSVKSTSRILSSIKSPENSQTVIYLKNYGNLSGGIIKKALKTPSRSVRSVKGVEISVSSFRRGLPVDNKSFIKNNEIFTNLNNQTLSLSGKSFLLSDKNQSSSFLSKNKEDKSFKSLLGSNLNNKEVSNFRETMSRYKNCNNNFNNDNNDGFNNINNGQKDIDSFNKNLNLLNKSQNNINDNNDINNPFINFLNPKIQVNNNSFMDNSINNFKNANNLLDNNSIFPNNKFQFNINEKDNNIMPNNPINNNVLNISNNINNNNVLNLSNINQNFKDNSNSLIIPQSNINNPFSKTYNNGFRFNDNNSTNQINLFNNKFQNLNNNYNNNKANNNLVSSFSNLNTSINSNNNYTNIFSSININNNSNNITNNTNPFSFINYSKNSNNGNILQNSQLSNLFNNNSFSSLSNIFYNKNQENSNFVNFENKWDMSKDEGDIYNDPFNPKWYINQDDDMKIYSKRDIDAINKRIKKYCENNREKKIYLEFCDKNSETLKTIRNLNSSFNSLDF